MADFTALKTAIQTYIKQNGNEEITGEKLQEILLSVVTTLGDSAINDLVTALANEVAARQNADGTLQQNITNEATARANGDTALSDRLGSSITAENTAADQIGAEAEARADADTALQNLIDGITNNIENGYVYVGIATPSSTPATGKVFYLALTAGTYSNFGNTEVSQGINILKYNGSAWSLDAFIGIDDTPTPGSPKLVKSGGAFDSVLTNGSAFDISAHFASGGTLATYADLSAALAALNTLSDSYKRGGMSIKFVLSSDNKYVQYRLMSETFNTTVANWQGVDDEPTAGSDNLVKSGGVANKISELKMEVMSLYDILDLDNIGYVPGRNLDAPHPQRCAIMNYIPIKKNVTVDIKSGYSFQIVCYTEIDGTPTYTDWLPSSRTLDVSTVLDGTKYIRMVIVAPTPPESAKDIFNSIKIEWQEDTFNELSKPLEKKQEDLLNDVLTIKPFTNGVDFGEIGNFTSTNGDYTLTPNNKFLCNLIPAKIGIGNKIKLYVPTGYILATNQYNSIVSGAHRVFYTASAQGNQTVEMVGEYLFFMLSRVDGNYISTKEIVNFYITIENKLFSNSDYFSTEEYDDYSNIIPNLKTYHGSINNNTGEWLSHNQQRTSDIIPIKPSSKLTLKTLTSEGDITIYAFFYNIDREGNILWQSQYQFPTAGYVNNYFRHPGVDFIIPQTVNAVRFKFVGVNYTIPEEMMTAENFVITLQTRNKFKNVGTLNPVKTCNKVVCSFTENDFVQGINLQNQIPLNKITSVNCFKVYPGQTLIFKFNVEHNTYIQVWEYASIVSTITSYTSYKNVSNNNTQYIVPAGINYIRLHIITYDASYTPALAVNDNIHIVDTSGNALAINGAEKLFEMPHPTSYAQGLAVQNGYLFQAFADGTIDIYDIATKTFIQNVVVPVASDAGTTVMHCNNLTFGKKYDAGDAFGVLWVNNESANTKMVGIRIQLTNEVFSLEKVYEVTPPYIDTTIMTPADDQYIDFVNNMLVQVVYKMKDTTNPSSYGDVYLSLYNFEGEFQDGEFKFIHSWEFPKMWAIQGGRLRDNILYLIAGTEGSVNGVYIFNVLTKELLGIIDLRKSCYDLQYEPQGIEIDNGERLISQCHNEIVDEHYVFHPATLYKLN